MGAVMKMRTAVRRFLVIVAVGVLAQTSLPSTEAGSEDWRYRERAHVSHERDGVRHQAGVNAGVDERAGFEAGLFTETDKRSGRSTRGRRGERQDERWFAGARGTAQAGAFTDAGAEHSANLKGVDVRNYAQGEAFVGSEAGLDAGISNNGAQLGLGAFSGGRVSGTLGTEIGPVGAAGTGEAWSGLGAEAGVNATMKKGKLKLGGELGAALGVGGKLKAEVTIDLNPVGEGARHVGNFAKDRGRDIGRHTKKISQNVGRTARKTGRAISGLFKRRR